MDWRSKVALQWMLARIPGGWRLNHGLQDLKPGDRREALRARLLARAAELAWAEDHGLGVEGADLLEVGTGRSPVPTLLMSLLGPRSLRTLDRRPLLDGRKLASIARELPGMAEALAGVLARSPREILGRAERLARAGSTRAILEAGSIRYEAPGDATATGLPAGSVDAIVSFDVLEHLPPATLSGLDAEGRRILRPGGRQFHVIGLGDHYASCDPRITSVHFLRHSDRAWDLATGHELSYHNRLRVPEFLEAFARDGFAAEAVRREVDPAGLEALKTIRVDPRFAGMPPEELATHRAALLLRRARSSAPGREPAANGRAAS